MHKKAFPLNHDEGLRPPLAAHGASRVVGVYVILSIFWAFFSAPLLMLFFPEATTMEGVSALKDIGFVILGALILFWMVYRQSTALIQEAWKERNKAFNLFATIADTSSEAVYIKTVDGGYQLGNRVMELITGQGSEEFINKTDAELIPTEMAATIMANDRSVITSGRKLTFIETFPTTRGVREFLSVKAPIFDETGHVTGIFGVSRDVTERRESEKRIRRAGKLYEVLSECTGEIICSSSRPELYLRVSRAISHYDAVKLVIVGRVDHEENAIVPLGISGETTDLVDENMGLCVSLDSPQGQEILRLEKEWLDALWIQNITEDPLSEAWGDSPVRHGWRSACFLPIRLHEKVESILMIFCSDVNAFDDETKRLFIELSRNISYAVNNFVHEELRMQNEKELKKLSLAIEQSPESIVITDVEGNIEYVNQGFVRRTGYSREEVVGRAPSFLGSGKTPKEVFEGMWRMISEGLPWKGRFFNRAKDGSEFIEFAHITPLRQADGRITHFVGIKEDVTEKTRLSEELDRYRHHLEELVGQRTRELSEARKMAEEANRAKSSFLAKMSHEIRTPINAIIGLTHLLRRPVSAEVLHERLNMVEGAGRHLLSVINDILDLSKIEADRLQLERSDFHLPGVIDNVVSIIAHLAREKGLELYVEYGNMPMWLRGDPMRLRQALLNYVSNAIKFTETGKIVIRTRLVEERAGAVLVRFEVEDTGIGIPPEKITEMFGAFQQLDLSTSRKYGGTGLGLSIVMNLARLMGGEAAAESTPGKGSLFWFTALLERGCAEALVRTVNIEQELQRICMGRRVLVAEDQFVNREVVIELLSSIGLEVDVAEDGVYALQKAKNDKYDIVLMDIQMPRMNGLEAAKEIRALEGYEKTPIIALTANVFEEDRAAAERASMNDFIVKPVEPDVLYSTLYRWLGGVALEEAVHSEDGVKSTLEPKGDALPIEENSILSILVRLDTECGMVTSYGIDLLRGDVKKYLSLIKRFVEAHLDDMNVVSRALQDEDIQPARHILHTLIGSAGTLGMGEVTHLLKLLHERVRGINLGATEIPDLSVEIKKIDTLFKRIHEVLESYSSRPESPEPTLVKPSVDDKPSHEVQSLVYDLLRFLAEKDAVSFSFFEKNRESFVSLWGNEAALLEQKIERFDFQGAEAHLLKLLERR